VFLEDYDLQLGRWLVSGVDVWLNNPIAPLEASGTSGMKAAVNGRLNLSVLDGWWGEAYTPDTGWGIPPVNARDPERRDALEAELIFEALEQEVVPLYYARNSHEHSSEWVRRSKRAMASVMPSFNTRRMVYDYASGLYNPAAQRYAKLAENNFAGAKTLAEWKQRVRQAWPRVVMRLLTDAPPDLTRGERLKLRVAVQLDSLQPSDVRIEFIGRRDLPESTSELPPLTSYGNGVRDGVWTAVFGLAPEREPDGAAVFALDALPIECGQFATQIRIYPWHELLTHPFEIGLMKEL
jgi:starch phosphorylase